jgi:L-serine dehydratase
MEQLSIFDIYKIGVGPSSSHTLGPWKAGLHFAEALKNKAFDAVEIHLFGSLSKTGIGHATDIAVQLGLEGYQPKTIITEKINDYINEIATKQSININEKQISFNPKEGIIFHNFNMPIHPNTLTFMAFHKKKVILEKTYYSVGGGFIEEEGVEVIHETNILMPYDLEKGQDILRITNLTNLSISAVVHQNELVFRNAKKIKSEIHEIYQTMLECIFKGCKIGGILPGGLNVKRRAKAIHKQLMGFSSDHFESVEAWITSIKSSPNTFSRINKWISCFALAVNEENAALSRVVTSPTNGAAGVIPAVIMYYTCFCDEYKGIEDIEKFILTSGIVGALFKNGATISAAVGGCQAEIGVSSAMAAAGLTEVLGGTPKQVLMAAEIAMEHHLGLTCDPIGGLVQIPCIERNTMGAMKAITASNLALSGNPDDALVNFDVVVKTMWDTAQDMNSKYKETSEGGLAFNLPVLMPNC